MKKRIGAAVVAAALAILVAPRASATEPVGTMTYDEWYQLANHQRIDKVSAACDCEGVTRAGYVWKPVHGRWHKQMVYAGDGGYAVVQYRMWPNHTWHVNRVKWWFGDDGHMKVTSYPHPLVR